MISGVGELLRADNHHTEEVAITLPSKIDKPVDNGSLAAALEKVINAQQATIQSQEITIAALSARIEQLEKKKKTKKKR